MPSLNPMMVQIPSLQDYFVDKDTGTPLSAGIVTFYEDTNHTVLKPVYKLSAVPGNDYSYTALSNPLFLSAVGTFIDENGNDIVPYFFPYDGTPSSTNGDIELYYITVYSAQGVFQFDREAWPNLSADSIIDDDSALTENLLSNPQFAEVSFSPLETTVISVTGSSTATEIAPDWSIVTSGSGTVTVQQIATSGASPIASNPPFRLDITSSGLSSPILLRQRLENVPTLLYGGFANGYFVAQSMDGAAHQLIMTFAPSTGANPATSYELINQLTEPTGFSEFTGTKQINGTIDEESARTAYVDITISIPQGAHIQISSIQLIGVPNINAEPGFTQTTVAREIDHLFHYYRDSIIIQSKDTILTGWDFPKNPYQFIVPTTTTAAVNQYVADQTIVIQQQYVKNNIGSNVQTSVDNENCFVVQALSANNQFGLLQYIDTRSMFGVWGGNVSSLVQCKISTSNNTALQVKMRLFYISGTPNTISRLDPISAWEVGGDPTFAAGYTAIAPLNDPVYTLNNGRFDNFSFNQFQLPSGLLHLNSTVGVFIYTIGNMNQTGTPDKFTICSASLVPNDFAITANQKTWDATLKECQFYYEKTYNYTVQPATVSAPGQRLHELVTQLVGTDLKVTSGFLELSYTPKRAAPSTIDIYSTASTMPDTFHYDVYNSGAVINSGDPAFSSYFSVLATGENSTTYAQNNVTPIVTYSFGATPIVSPFAFLAYQATIDSRLGV